MNQHLVKAPVNTKEPHDAHEVKSFLRLINFSALYIPDLATISEPLRTLKYTNRKFFGRKGERKFREA